MKILGWLKNIARALINVFESSKVIEKSRVPRIIFIISRELIIPCYYVNKMFQHLNVHRWHGRY